MRFGLDRMQQLMTVLDLPQRRFESNPRGGHLNGKLSTARFCAAIFARDGIRTGSYPSPHWRSFRERIEVAESPSRRPPLLLRSSARYTPRRSWT